MSLSMMTVLQMPHLGPGSKTGYWKGGGDKQKQGPQVLLLENLLSPKLCCYLFKAEIPQVGLHPWANLRDDWPRATYNLWIWKMHGLPLHASFL